MFRILRPQVINAIRVLSRDLHSVVKHSSIFYSSPDPSVFQNLDSGNDIKNGKLPWNQVPIPPKVAKSKCFRRDSSSNSVLLNNHFTPIFPPPNHENISLPLSKILDIIFNDVQLPSSFIYPPLIIPSLEPPTAYECVNDIGNRRRKMKKHKRRKWHKKYASLMRKYRMHRNRKQEKKLQELFELWRNRSEAWDPASKIERGLVYARRSGYYVDILSTRGGIEDTSGTDSVDPNPISETQKGQTAIFEVTNIVRDLTFALNRVYETVRDTQGTKHLNAELPKNFKDRVDTFQNRRNAIKEAFHNVLKFCSQLNVDNPEDVIPFLDERGKTIEIQQDSERVVQLKMDRDNILKQIAELDAQLLSYKNTLTSALWELSDLTA